MFGLQNSTFDQVT